MILRLVNLIFLSVITIAFLFPYPVPAREPSTVAAHSTLPDLGNLSEKDSIFDLNTRKFNSTQQRQSYELYLYSLSLRLMAIRNILKVSSITRTLGSALGIDDQFLEKLPYSLKKNFPNERFPDLNSLMYKISSSAPKQGGIEIEDISIKLAARAIELLELLFQKYELDIKEREETERSFKETKDVVRTKELPGYNKKIRSIDDQIALKNYNFEQLSRDLFLFLPFYDDPWYEDLWNSVVRGISPSYHFSHLLIASIFYSNRPDESFRTPEDFAKWLNSGIDDEDQFRKLAQFYRTSEASRKVLKNQLEEGKLPLYISTYVETALKKAITRSIRMQNSSLDFLASSQYVCKEKDAISCHSNPALKQSLLPEQLAFLSQMTGLKVQFARVYAPFNMISKHRSNVLWHRLGGIYEDQLMDKERNWIVPLRLLVLTAAILVPWGWVALAVLAGYEMINMTAAFEVASQTELESETLMTLYDEENAFEKLDDDISSSLSDYKRFIFEKDKYRTEAVSNMFWGPVETALYYIGVRWVRGMYISAKGALFANPKSIKVYVKVATFLALTYFVLKDSISMDKDEAIEIMIDDRTARKKMQSDPDFMNKVRMRRSQIDDKFISDIFDDPSRTYADRDIGFLDFIASKGSKGGGLNIPIVLNDHGATRLLENENGQLKFYFNYEKFTDDSITVQEIIYQMAYVFYLYRTSALIARKSLIDEEYYNSFLDFLLPGSEKDGGNFYRNIEKYELELEAAKKSGLFGDAAAYATLISGSDEN